jgi:hypothetical protein
MSFVVRLAPSLARFSIAVSLAPLFAAAAAVSTGQKTMNVLVELTQKPIATAGADAKAQLKRVLAEQDRLLAAMKRAGIKATIVYRVQRSLNGIALIVAPDQIDRLRTLPGFKRVQITEPEHLTSSPAPSPKPSKPVHKSTCRPDASRTSQ